MTATSVKTFTILDQEFDMDALNDIAKHGCEAGVSGFIYSSELHDVFDKHEDKIFDYLDDYADQLGEKSGMQMIINYLTRDDDYYCMQDIKEKAVWMYVELNAVDLLLRNEHPDWV